MRRRHARDRSDEEVRAAVLAAVERAEEGGLYAGATAVRNRAGGRRDGARVRGAYRDLLASGELVLTVARPSPGPREGTLPSPPPPGHATPDPYPPADDPGHEARILAHQRRVEQELTLLWQRGRLRRQGVAGA